MLFYKMQKAEPPSGIDRPSDSANDGDIDVYKEQFGMRFLVRCEGFKLRLQANLVDDGQPEQLDNVSW
jgi:hypothetical protein